MTGSDLPQPDLFGDGVPEDERSLLARFAALELAVGTMNGWWSRRVLRASVYTLPVLEERSVPEVLEAETLRGERAIEAAARAYRQFRLLDIQDAGTAFRLPGWIVVDADELEPVHEVNRLKGALREAIRSLEEEGPARERLCRRLFPGCSMNQIYRRVVVQESPIEALRFTWSPSTVATTRLAPQAVHENLGKRLEEARAQGRHEWVQALEIARGRLASLPSSAVVLRRRPVAPHPRATLFVSGGATGTKSMVHANLPIVLSRACAEVPVKDLRSFDRERRRRQRSDKRVLEPILEGLYLYVERAAR